MPPPEAATPKPKRRRRWLQFSVRSLLVLTLLLAAFLGWVRIRLDRIAREDAEDAALAAILDLGGGLSYEPGTALFRQPQEPRWVRLFRRGQSSLGFKGVIFPRGLGDEAGALIDLLPSVTRLDLRGAQLSIEGLNPIWKHRELIYLDLSSTAIGDEDAVHLAELSELTGLKLANTAVTDRTVERLAGLPKLSHLDLRGTHVTAAGIEWLKSARGSGMAQLVWSPAPSESARQIAASLEQSGADVEAEPVEERAGGRQGVRAFYCVTLSNQWKGGMKELEPLGRLHPLFDVRWMQAPLTEDERAYVASLRLLRLQPRPQGKP